MAILYHVPIIHSIEDYGPLQDEVKDAFVREYGAAVFVEMQRQIRDYWTMVEERVEKAIPDPHGLRIYHDGFPVGSREKVLALFGYMLRDHLQSPNFQLVKKLLDKGAILEGTEDMMLTVEQVRIYEYTIRASSKEEQQRIAAVHADRAQELVELRDDVIAQRICDTLSEEDRGILFIGRDHNVIPKLEILAKGIAVVQV